MSKKFNEIMSNAGLDLNADAFVPVERLRAGDRISLKDSVVLDECECSACSQAKTRAQAGEAFTVLQLMALPTGDIVIDTSGWGGVIPLGMRVCVKEFGSPLDL